MSAVRQIINAVEARAGQIAVASRYHTDAGQRIFRGENQFTPEDGVFPCCTLSFGEVEPQEPETSLERKSVRVSVTAVALADRVAPLDIELALLEDLQRALSPVAHRRDGRDNLDGAALYVDFEGTDVQEREPGGLLCAVRYDLRAHYLETPACSA